MAIVSLITKGSSNTTSQAPNVLTATASPVYALSSHTSVFGFTGTISLPTGATNYSQLQTIEVTAYQGTSNAKATTIAQFSAPFTGASITYTGGSFTTPLSGTQTWTVVFTCYDVNGLQTGTPYTVSSITVSAISISGLTATDDTADRWQDATTQALHAVVPVAVTLTHYPALITLWTKGPQYGLIWHGWFEADSSDTIKIGAQGSNTAIYPPTAASETVTVYAAIGTYDSTVDPTTISTASNTTVSVSAPATMSATASSSATAGTVTYYAGPGGANCFNLDVNFNLNLTDPNFFFARLTMQTGAGTGGSFVAGGAHPTEVAIGDWAGPTKWYQVQDHAPFMAMVSASITSSTQIVAHVGQGGNWTVPSDSNTTFRFKLYVASRLDDGSGGTKVLQASWPSSATYVDVVVDGTKSYTSTSKIASSTLGGGLTGGSGTNVSVNAGSGLQLSGSQVALKYGSALADDGSGAVTVVTAGPLYKDVSHSLNMNISSDFVVSGGALTQNAVNLTKAYGFDTTIFGGGGGSSVLTINGLAVNKLLAGTAFFAGTATFAYTATGPYVQVGSSGAVFADNYSSPTSTVTINSTGFTAAKGSNSVSVQAGGVYISGPSGTLNMTSGGIALTNGSSSVSIVPSAVTIANGSLSSPTISGGSISGTSLSITTGSGTVNINSGSTGVTVAYGSSVSQVYSAGFYTTDSSHTSLLTPTSLQVCGYAVVNSSGQWTGYGGVSCPSATVQGYTMAAGSGGVTVNGAVAINSSNQFTGYGVFCPSYSGSFFSLSVGGGGIFSSGTISGTHSGSWSGSFNCSGLTINGYSGLSGYHTFGFYAPSGGGYCTLSVDGGLSGTGLSFYGGLLYTHS